MQLSQCNDILRPSRRGYIYGPDEILTSDQNNEAWREIDWTRKHDKIPLSCMSPLTSPTSRRVGVVPFPSNWLGVDPDFLYFGSGASSPQWIPHTGNTLPVSGVGGLIFDASNKPNNTNYSELDTTVQFIPGAASGKYYREIVNQTYGNIGLESAVWETVASLAHDNGSPAGDSPVLIAKHSSPVAFDGWVNERFSGKELSRINFNVAPPTSVFSNATTASIFLHLLFMFDAAALKAQWFVNGVASGLLTTISPGNPDNISRLTIGNFDGTGVGFGANATAINGEVSEVGLWTPPTLGFLTFASVALARFNDLFSGAP